MVQDYFKYDKIQTGTSLFINANDGTKTQEGRGLPLGIKSTVQGIKHFTNWQDIASSIDAKNTLRFEDAQPNKVYYKTNNTKASSLFLYYDATDASYGYTPTGDGLGTIEFTDEWAVNDIKIIDDLAIVSYPDYTDIHKTQIQSSSISLRQPMTVLEETAGYDYLTTVIEYLGGLVFSIEDLPIMHKAFLTNGDADSLVNSTNSAEETNPTAAQQTYLSNHFAHFENVILKVQIPAGDYSDSDRTLYFVYGGATKNKMPEFENNSDLLFQDFRFASSGNTQYSDIVTETDRNFYDFSDGDFAGYYYLITEDASVMSSINSSYKNNHSANERNPSGRVHIQLSVGNYPATTPESAFGQVYNAFVSKYINVTDVDTTKYVGYLETVANATATFTKYTPVRKCGKVEIYTKKSGIFTSIVGNRITSPGHTLQTNDIIKISSAMWDGTQTGALDHHPLNGDKFVKVIDSDTFDLFDDQYFSEPSTTSKLKTTDDIVWVCIGSSNGNEAQSWQYNQTLLSPTGRNGYRSTSTVYKTTNRLKDVFLSGNNYDKTDLENNSVYLDFSIFADARYGGGSMAYGEDRSWGILDQYSRAIKSDEAAKLGKMLKNFEEAIPSPNLGTSPLDTMNKGPQDFYPFDVQESTDGTVARYQGTRFGAAIDMAYSHTSGTSKIYTLVVGEPGSDMSVDLFGVSEEEYTHEGNYPFWLHTTDGSFDSISNVGRKRLLPYHMPHGKVHVFTITVDRYGRISDVSHQNSVHGDGSSLNNTCSNEQHPWETFMGYVRTTNYIGVNGTIPSKRQAQGWNYDDPSFTDHGVTDSASYIRMEDYAPFNEVLPNESSLYWDRSAIISWFGVDEYDYYTNLNNTTVTINNNIVTCGGRALLRRGSIFTRDYTSSNSGTVGSRFGVIGDAALVIDRFGQRAGATVSQFYIMPWVDSFGKSVAVSESNSSGEILVFGGSNTRSNIDYRSVSRDRVTALGTYGETVLRPVFIDVAGTNVNEGDFESQMGQVSCVRVDRTSSYNTTQVVEINDGGSVDTSTTPVDSGEVITRVNTVGSVVLTVKELRDGEGLGSGHEPTLRSIRSSMQSLVFKDGYLFWADHNLNYRHSRLRKFTINTSNNSFIKSGLNTQEFVDQINTAVTSDGLGWDIRYDKGILLTNALTNTNDFHQFITAVSKYDTVIVFTTDNGLENQQKISATFSSIDERYTDKLVQDYVDNIIDIGNTTYDNHTLRSHTWNIKMLGRYDVIDDKILLKDPVEYVLFGYDASFDRIRNKTTALRTYDRSADPYLQYTEVFKDDTIYYDYANPTKWVVADKTIWDVDGVDTLNHVDGITRTPVFFVSVPQDAVNLYGDLKIILNKEVAGRLFGSTWDLNSFGLNLVSDSYISVMPKLALYKKDPRAMIIPNGPSHTGTDATGAASYTNGIYDYTWSTFSTVDANKTQSPATPPLFRGGANDLFMYSSNPGGIPRLMPVETNSTYDYSYARQYYDGEKNLGELFDITYNQFGNTNKGIISWFAGDVRYYTTPSEEADVVPYGNLYYSYSNIGGGQYRFSIPYSVWSQYVVDDNLIKSSADNRPMFNDFTRIKHGTAGAGVNPSTGTWDYTYDDVNRPTYNATAKKSNFTIMLGFVFNRYIGINQNGNNDYDTTLISQLMRHINPSEARERRYDSQYSYNNLIGNTELADGTQNFSQRSTIHNIDFSTTINDIDFSFNVTTTRKRKYKAKFHKIAYYEYNNEVYSEVQKNLINSLTSQVEKYTFGRYGFTPLPIGISRDKTLNVDVAVSKNPIIRVGKSKDSTTITDGRATFSKSVQVLSSDSVGTKDTIDSTFYAENDQIHYRVQPTGVYFGDVKATFADNAILGGFDFESPEYLTLSIYSNPTDKSATTLQIRDTRGSGLIPLQTHGKEVAKAETTLVISNADKSGTDFNLHVLANDVSNKDANLQIAAALDSIDDIDLSIFGHTIPTAYSSMKLFAGTIVGEPASGDMTLHIGPYEIENDAPLYINAQFTSPGTTLYSAIGDLYVSGSIEGERFKDMPLCVMSPGTGTTIEDIPLYISTPIPDIGAGGGYVYTSGITTFVEGNNNANVYYNLEKSMTLAVEATIQATGSIPLYIERNTANGITLTVSSVFATGDISLATSGAYTNNGTTDLFISAPTTTNIPLITRGFLE